MPASVWGILLGGGRSSRMGADKLNLIRDGATLAERGADALLRVADRVVIASPERPGLARPGVEFVLEDPPFGGPVAGIAAAVEAIDSTNAEAYLLAGDLADPSTVIGLLREADLGDDGVALIDDEGWPQYLAGRYRVEALRRVLKRGARDRSVKRTFAPLKLALVPASDLVVADLDTPEQARHAGVVLPPRAPDQRS